MVIFFYHTYKNGLSFKKVPSLFIPILKKNSLNLSTSLVNPGNSPNTLSFGLRIT